MIDKLRWIRQFKRVSFDHCKRNIHSPLILSSEIPIHTQGKTGIRKLIPLEFVADIYECQVMVYFLLPRRHAGVNGDRVTERFINNSTSLLRYRQLICRLHEAVIAWVNTFAKLEGRIYSTFVWFFSSRPCECIWLAILEHKTTIVLALKNRYGDQWNKVVIWLLAL